VGLQPEKYMVVKDSDIVGTFANNDIEFTDSTGAEHDSFDFGLKKSLLNYMHGACFDYPLHKWFDFKVPKTSIPPDFIFKALEEAEPGIAKPTSKVVWLGNQPAVELFIKNKKGEQYEKASLTFVNKQGVYNITVDKPQGLWLAAMLQQLSVHNAKPLTLQQVKDDYEAAGMEDFELFWDNKPVNTLYQQGLLVL
ncbi:MAG: radical SAM protein, partial [Taibaiella sp.]|nr:radical SAM protein [Taibaiella sp.]